MFNYKDNNNEIDIDDFINNICASNYYQQVYNNKEEKTDIQTNSKSNRTSNKSNGLLDTLRMIKQDRCPKCGVKISTVFICGVRGDEKMALTCQECDANISACSRV